MAQPRLALIVARARNGVIGRDNALPWRLRDDLKQFKQRTLGHPVIMGRKTWESLGRPLPGRANIVVSRQADFSAEGAQVVSSLEAALAVCGDVATAFVIGGAQLYALALPLADQIYITEVDAEVEGDAWFRPDLSAFERAGNEHFAVSEGNEFAFDVVEYRRRT
jgi:dihydrofolate reductase